MRVVNAVDFRLELGRIRAQYESLFRPRIRELRAKYSGPELAVLDATLEAHLRAYFVDALLRSLNWRMSVEPQEELPNLVVEAPMRYGDAPRYLDYFGFETRTGTPLLIVETKHPGSPLPARITGMGRGEAPPDPRKIAQAVADGLRGDQLVGEWPKWLERTREYVRAVVAGDGRPPKRVMMSDGEWLIVFRDPANAFLDGGPPDAEEIVVFVEWVDIEARSREIFELLEHQAVLGTAGPLLPGEIRAFVQPADVARGMHALKVLHFDEPTHNDAVPVINVAPIFYLQSRCLDWLLVDPREGGEKLPHGTRPEELAEHFDLVREKATRLRQIIEKVLGREIPLQPLESHYADAPGFEAVKGVTEQFRQGPQRRFIVLTGSQTHYLMREASVPSCPYHEFRSCAERGVATPYELVLERSVKPRSYFVSGEVHHCAHRDIIGPKAVRISLGDETRTGPRSGAAFCEIYPFEQRLCCRTCVFEKVCTGAEMFSVLPCESRALEVAR